MSESERKMARRKEDRLDELERPNALSYIDLLILTLTQHEKNLSLIIEKLEQISDKLDAISRRLEEKKIFVNSC